MPSLPSRVSSKLFLVKTLAEAGVLQPTWPDRLVTAANALIRFGPTPAAGYKAAAARIPNNTAVIDERGTVTFREIHERSNAIAHALSDAGVNEGDSVGLMMRNHRGFVESLVACSKLGAHVLFLNTAFSGPQLTEVCKREKPKAVLYDEEFEEVLHDATRRRLRYIGWYEADTERSDPTLDEIAEGGRHLRRHPAVVAGQGDHPHERHDRHAEGRLALPAEVARPRRLAAEPDPAQGAGEHADRGAAVPCLGLRALHARAWRSTRRSCSSASSIRRASCRSPRSTSAPRSWWSR